MLNKCVLNNLKIISFIKKLIIEDYSLSFNGATSLALSILSVPTSKKYKIDLGFFKPFSSGIFLLSESNKIREKIVENLFKKNDLFLKNQKTKNILKKIQEEKKDFFCCFFNDEGNFFRDCFSETFFKKAWMGGERYSKYTLDLFFERENLFGSLFFFNGLEFIYRTTKRQRDNNLISRMLFCYNDNPLIETKNFSPEEKKENYQALVQEFQDFEQEGKEGSWEFLETLTFDEITKFKIKEFTDLQSKRRWNSNDFLEVRSLQKADIHIAKIAVNLYVFECFRKKELVKKIVPRVFVEKAIKIFQEREQDFDRLRFKKAHEI